VVPGHDLIHFETLICCAVIAFEVPFVVGSYYAVVVVVANFGDVDIHYCQDFDYA
jgi:hypothetical protein